MEDEKLFGLPMLEAAWRKDKRTVAQLILRDSGLTRRLDRKQLEHLSRIAGCR